jgi:hypothetical protein
MGTDAPPLGWTVQVAARDGVIVFYAAGYPMPGDAEKAVKKVRSADNEMYRAVDPITNSHGPRIGPHEVREI